MLVLNYISLIFAVIALRTRAKDNSPSVVGIDVHEKRPAELEADYQLDIEAIQQCVPKRQVRACRGLDLGVGNRGAGEILLRSATVSGSCGRCRISCLRA